MANRRRGGAAPIQRRPHLTAIEKGIIYGRFIEVAKKNQLAKEFNRNRSFNARIIKKLRETGSGEREVGSGNSYKLTKQDIH